MRNHSASPLGREEARQQKSILLVGCPLQGAASKQSLPSLVLLGESARSLFASSLSKEEPRRSQVSEVVEGRRLCI